MISQERYQLLIDLNIRRGVKPFKFHTKIIKSKKKEGENVSSFYALVGIPQMLGNLSRHAPSSYVGWCVGVKIIAKVAKVWACKIKVAKRKPIPILAWVHRLVIWQDSRIKHRVIALWQTIWLCCSQMMT